MSVDHLLALAHQIADAHAQAQLNQAYARHATSQTTYDDFVARADYWDTQATAADAALTAALHDALPAVPETFLPVRVLGSGHLDLHAHDSHDHPVVVRLTGEQALTLGAHLIAYAAIGLDRTGTKITTALPPLPAHTITGATDTPHGSTTGVEPAAGRTSAPATRRPHPHRAGPNHDTHHHRDH